MVLPQYELVPKLEFVSYYYQLLVRYTCIARMRFWWFVHYASTRSIPNYLSHVWMYLDVF